MSASAHAVGVAARGLRKPSELARGHGTRLQYLAGCHCDACRTANTAYERDRRRARKDGDWNGIVPAARARAHMLKLSRQGIGRRSIGMATDISDTVLCDIRRGQKKHIRARTERKILAVTPASASDRAYIPAARTHALIAELLAEDYTQAYLSARLGYVRPYFQFGQRITVLNAARIERLYQELMS